MSSLPHLGQHSVNQITQLPFYQKMEHPTCNEPVGESAAIPVAEERGRGALSRFREALTRFKRDIREPLPNSENLSRFGRIKMRTRHLFKRYGWKMFWGIVVFYLVRDTILYLVLPYLLAREVIG